MKRVLSLILMAFAVSAGAWPMGSQAAERYPSVLLEVEIDQHASLLRGVAHGTVPEGEAVALLIPHAVKVNGVLINGKTGGLPRLQRILSAGRGARFSIPFTYRLPGGKQFALEGGWCPILSGRALYSLRVKAPKGVIALSEAEEIKSSSHGPYTTYEFLFPHPRRGISLVAGPYRIFEKKTGGVTIQCYLLPGEENLARLYLDKADYYIRLYIRIIGPFPFRRFAVVENTFPTGFGFSTYTLLGKRVMHLPFIPDTSLPHEIVHSWFGNGVGVAPGAGDWCEAMATYLADYLLQDRMGRGVEKRHDMLIKVNSHPWTSGITIRGFKGQRSRHWRAMGYEGGAMLLHMLRRRVGDEPFWKGIHLFYERNRFSEAGWDDLISALEAASGRKLRAMANRWLDAHRFPSLEMTRAWYHQGAEGFETCLEVVQSGAEQVFPLDLPLLIRGEGGGASRFRVSMDGRHIQRCFSVGFRPREVVLDPDFDILRRLSPGEFPATISSLLGPGRLKLASKGAPPKEIIQAIEGLGISVLDGKREGASAPTLWLARSLDEAQGFVPQGLLSTAASPAPSVPWAVLSVGGTGNCWSGEQGVEALLIYNDVNAAIRLISLAPHYGKYSRLTMEGGRVTRKEEPKYGRGVVARPEAELNIGGIAASSIISLDRILQVASRRPVVFVGERHDDFAAHLTQLEVIRWLHGHGRKVAVGMEMFQRPFQPVLDRFIGGELDLRGLLEQSEYYKRWRYDFHLYEPILRFCRENRIPVIALNIRAEISKKVAQKGVDGLGSQERTLLPKEIQWNNPRYRARLQRIFRAHPPQGVMDFRRFYQAQVIWDETMAETAANYLSAHPGTTMVIMAGAGHVEFGDGIPARLARRGYQGTILLPNPQGAIDPAMADYLLFPEEAQAPFSAKLGVYLDKEGERLVVKEVMDGSPAARGGVEPGDVILSFQGPDHRSRPIRDIADLRLELFFIKPGDTARLVVKRKLRFRPDKTIELELGPFGTAAPPLHRKPGGRKAKAGVAPGRHERGGHP